VLLPEFYKSVPGQAKHDNRGALCNYPSKDGQQIYYPIFAR